MLSLLVSPATHAIPALNRVCNAEHTSVLPRTGFGGRNRKVAEAFVKTRKPFEQLEDEMLGGQKLQGTSTAEDVNKFLKARGEEDKYPLFKIVHAIAFEGMDPEQLTHQLSDEWQTLFGNN